MKTNRIQKLFGAAGLALATAAIATVALAADVQYRAVGDDGIAASPKVRQALDAKAASATVATTKTATMACSKCQDIVVTSSNPQAKASEIMAGDTKVVAKHTCGGCESNLDVVGTGKGKQTVATHKCTAAVANNLTCCSAMK
jgi:hypothetical protein